MPSKYATVASECQQRVKCAQHDASERLSFIHMAALCVVMVFSLFVGSAFAQDDVTAFFDRADTTSTTTIDHTVWTKLLQKHVVVGKPDQLNRIDYRAFKSSDHAQLKAYVAQLEAIDPRQYNRKEQFAYWANL